MYEYKCKIVKIVDGDTVDVDLDLGFGVWMRDERVRVMGIDPPESRTSDKVEKVFGLAAKARLSSLLGDESILRTQVSKNGENMKGKFGRILGNFICSDGISCASKLVAEGHAVRYTGGNKDEVQAQHLANRQRLVDEGKVVLVAGMHVTAPAQNQKAFTPEPNDAPIKKVVSLDEQLKEASKVEPTSAANGHTYLDKATKSVASKTDTSAKMQADMQAKFTKSAKKATKKKTAKKK